MNFSALRAEMRPSAAAGTQPRNEVPGLTTRGLRPLVDGLRPSCQGLRPWPPAQAKAWADTGPRGGSPPCRKTW
eukprot:NODE_5685_length_684_cov_9.258268_g4808_i0.p3 GENE.NODE_5685_length_684_cov_9.258268_g4808_i0~~NODE_5685_length_684_cov_9.258268_g4808_i0.p3  ORF type:complete len:74 (+),score=3.76 NODE_5685_length_684_cov_9.258268_g4808_i0:146-367(+)